MAATLVVPLFGGVFVHEKGRTAQQQAANPYAYCPPYADIEASQAFQEATPRVQQKMLCREAYEEARTNYNDALNACIEATVILKGDDLLRRMEADLNCKTNLDDSTIEEVFEVARRNHSIVSR